MSKCMKRKVKTVVVTGMALMLSVAIVSDDWREEVRQRLLKEHSCELNYITGIRSFELLGNKTVTFRAHCTDERSFDVTRAEGSSDFEIRACGNVEC